MDQISDIHFGPLPADSPYVKPFRFYFKQNGVAKDWDLLKVHDSVAVILYNTTRKCLVFVKQFRPAIYYAHISSQSSDLTTVDVEKFPASLAITTELCAGIVDKDLPLVEIAREELLEECGYKVTSDRIELVLTYKSGVGTSGAVQTMFYCEVTDADKVEEGGGVDDELIEIVECSLEEAKQMFEAGRSHISPPAFLFGVLWFLTHRAPKS